MVVPGEICLCFYFIAVVGRIADDLGLGISRIRAVSNVSIRFVCFHL